MRIRRILLLDIGVFMLAALPAWPIGTVAAHSGAANRRQKKRPGSGQHIQQKQQTEQQTKASEDDGNN